MGHRLIVWDLSMGNRTNHFVQASLTCTTGMKSLIYVSEKYESHVKCSSCMLGKATLEDYPKLTRKQVLYAVFLIISWIYCRTYSCCDFCLKLHRISIDMAYRMSKVAKQWYSIIAAADLPWRARHKLVIFMRYHSSENKSTYIKEFSESVGVINDFSTFSAQWQNGAAE